MCTFLAHFCSFLLLRCGCCCGGFSAAAVLVLCVAKCGGAFRTFTLLIGVRTSLSPSPRCISQKVLHIAGAFSSSFIDVCLSFLQAPVVVVGQKGGTFLLSLSLLPLSSFFLFVQPLRNCTSANASTGFAGRFSSLRLFASALLTINVQLRLNLCGLRVVQYFWGTN